MTATLAHVQAPDPTSAMDAEACLSSAARAELRRLIPVGSTVQFEQSGSKVLIYDTSGGSVNVAVVRSGWALTAEDPVGVPDDFAAALSQARADRVGLHSAEQNCTAPSVLAEAGLDCLTVAAAIGASASPSPSPSTQSSTSSTASSTTPSPSAASTVTAASADLREQLEDAVDAYRKLLKLTTWIDDNEDSLVWRA